jgi:hypothetical protein
MGKKIKDLKPITIVGADDEVIIEQASGTKRTKVATIADRVVEMLNLDVDDISGLGTAARKNIGSQPGQVQEALVSGQNIKTINNQSLLGNGNLSVVIDISGKQDVLQSGVNIATINGQNLLDGGNISIDGGEGSIPSLNTINGLSLFGTGNILVQPVLTSGQNIARINGNSILTGSNIQLQTPLQSGVSIKTINGESILASGNINAVTGLRTRGEQDFANGDITLRTINGQSLVGSTDLVITAEDGGISYLDSAFTPSSSGGVTAAASSSFDVNTSTLTLGITLGTVYATSVADSVQSIQVGGAPAAPASSWKTKNLVEVLDTILFPTLNPTYVVPTLTLTVSGASSAYEVGDVYSVTFTAQGIKNDAGVFSAIVVRRDGTPITTSSITTATTTNVPDQFGYPSSNNPNARYTVTAQESVTLSTTPVSWAAVANYAAGQPRKTNKGADDGTAPAVRTSTAPQAAATNFSSNTVSVTPIYPYFWGKSATPLTAQTVANLIQSGDSSVQKVLAPASGTVTIDFDVVNGYIWMAHVSEYPDKVRWYVDQTNNEPMSASSWIAPAVAQNITSSQGKWSNKPFRVYISRYPSSQLQPVEFRQTLS